MDYTARYSLKFNPFLKNSKEVFVDTQEQKETLYRLDYLASTKGFGLLTGSAARVQFFTPSGNHVGQPDSPCQISVLS